MFSLIFKKCVKQKILLCLIANWGVARLAMKTKLKKFRQVGKKKSIDLNKKMRVGVIQSVAILEKWLEWNKRARGKINSTERLLPAKANIRTNCIKRLCSALGWFLKQQNKRTEFQNRTAPGVISLRCSIVAIFVLNNCGNYESLSATLIL